MKGQESNRGKAKHSTGETWRAGLPQCCLWPRVRQLAFHNPTLLSRSLKPTPEGCKALQVLPAAESHEIKKKKNEPKTLTDPSPKKMYKWQMSKWKNVPPDVSSGKCKLNWDTTIYPLECQNPGPWQYQVLVRVWDNRNSHSLTAGGRAKWYSPFGR